MIDSRIITYFNSNYIDENGKSYYKLSVTFCRNNFSYDVFSVFISKSDNSANDECHCSVAVDKMDLIINGYNPLVSNLVVNPHENISFNTNEDKDNYVKCITKIPYALTKYLSIKNKKTLTNNDKEMLADVCKEFCSSITKSYLINEFKDFDSSSWTRDDIMIFANAVNNAMKNNKSTFIINDNEFIIVNDDKGKKSVKMRKLTTNTRNFIQMAKVINASGLNEVVEGNFYPIVDTPSFNGKNYVSIDVNGEKRTLVSNRIKLVNVFTEKP